MINFSIIVCSYNPDVVILKRLLKAVQSFGEGALSKSEIIIIDNNSSPRLADNKDVQQFLLSFPFASLIVEPVSGLTAARLSGIVNARYEWLIFFDDDNEPQKNYLQILAQSIDEYPEVGAWGPGNIEVEYIANTEEWLQSKKTLFQQRNQADTMYSNDESGWNDCFPFGTGLCIKKEIAKMYSENVKNNIYTLTDRRGKSLSSGGDVQLVLTAIKNGWYAGSIHNLSLNHLINSTKANLKYLIKQQYGTTSSFVSAYDQVFQEKRIQVSTFSNKQLVFKIYSLYRIHRNKLNSINFKLLMAEKLGEVNAAFLAVKKEKPFVLKIYEKLIGYN